MNGGIINSITRLHLVGYFYRVILRCTDPWILNKQMKINRMKKEKERRNEEKKKEQHAENREKWKYIPFCKNVTQIFLILPKYGLVFPGLLKLRTDFKPHTVYCQILTVSLQGHYQYPRKFLYQNHCPCYTASGCTELGHRDVFWHPSWNFNYAPVYMHDANFVGVTVSPKDVLLSDSKLIPSSDTTDINAWFCCLNWYNQQLMLYYIISILTYTIWKQSD
jgi:hypothetical protein